jgi:hypothetical protein
MNVRSVEFYRNGSLIEVSSDNITCYATSTYAYAGFDAFRAFDTSLSKIDDHTNNSWQSYWPENTTNQRLICVFDSEITFDTIVVNNCHVSGSQTNHGAKNTKIYSSSDTITDTTYGSVISNSELLFDGQLNQHAATNTQDDQTLQVGESDIYEEALSEVVNITQLDTYQKQSFFIGNFGASSSINKLKFIASVPGAIYNIDNMRFDSDQETYWLDVCEYTTNSGVQDEYITTTSGLEVTTTTDMVSYGNRAIKLSADTTTSGASCTRTFSLLVNTYSTAKSVIFDFADNYGGYRQAIRSIEFYLNNSLLTMTDNFTSYVTSYYDQEWTSSAAMVFNTTLSKIDGDANTAWVAENSSSNQRLIIVFDESTEFDTIVINNAHNNGSGTNQGVKNTKIYISDDEVTSTVYGETITNSELIFDSTINEHVASNIEDDQTLAIILTQGESISGTGRIPSTNTLLFDMASNRLGANLSFSLEYILPLSNTHTAKSFILDVADNWGDSSWIGIRSIDFWYNDSKITLSTSDFSSYATSEYSSQYHAENLFDTSISKTGSIADTSWLTDLITNRRIICVFNSEQNIDGIRINNIHSAGGLTTRGAKNVKAYFSTDTITDTTYNAAISNSTLVYDGQFEKHSTQDAEDEQILTVSGTGGGVETKNMSLDVVGINRFRNYSIILFLDLHVVFL